MTKRIGFLTLALVAPAILADVIPGGARDGGDAPVKRALWACQSVDEGWKVDVDFGERVAAVREISGKVVGRFEKLYPQLMAYDAYREVTPGNIASQALGFTRSLTHYTSDASLDFALSIYLEKVLAADQYSARFSARLGGQLVKGISLVCRHQPPARLPDPVDSVRMP